MLDFVLSSSFVGVYLALLSGICLLGVAKLRAGSRLFQSMIQEFLKWKPSEQDQEVFEAYKLSVHEFAVRSSTKTCGMWSSFLDDVQLGLDSSGTQAVECAAESLDKLRDNLIFAYTTSHRMSRLNGSVLAGLGFAGTLVMICAATLAAEPFLSGSSQIEQALSTLLSGGGMAFICAVVGIISSLAFTAFERSEMTAVESLVDGLISTLRSKIAFRTERHYLSTISSQISFSSHAFSKFAQDIGDKVVNLKDSQLSLAVIEESNRELARDLSTSFDASSSRVVEAINDTHEKAQRLREDQVGYLTSINDYSEKNDKWWEKCIENMRNQLEWSERQHDVMGRIETELQNSSTREERILDTLIAISKGIEELDEGIQEDVDHLVLQNKETQTALMHYLNDTLELHLTSLGEQLTQSNEQGTQRSETMTQALEKALDGVRASIETHSDTQGDYLRNVRTSLEAGIGSVRSAIEQSSTDRNESNRRLVDMLQLANFDRARELEEIRGIEKERMQRESIRDARDREYWERQLKLHEEETDIERRILEEQRRAIREGRERSMRRSYDEASYIEKLSRLRDGRFSVDMGDGEMLEVSRDLNRDFSREPGRNTSHSSQDSEQKTAVVAPRLDLSRLIASLGSARSALESASKNFGLVAEYSRSLDVGCKDVLRELNKMNEDLLDQTELRLNRYGKAYQPLAESNLLICELMTRAIKDVGNFKRSMDFNYDEISAQVEKPSTRLMGLERNIIEMNSQNSLAQSQLLELENWWSDESSTNDIENYVVELKSDIGASGKAFHQANEVAGELRKHVMRLRTLIEINILDQVTNWPAVLDEARVVRDAARRLGAHEKKLGRTSKKSDERFSLAISKINETVEKSETLVLNAAGREARGLSAKKRVG